MLEKREKEAHVKNDRTGDEDALSLHLEYSINYILRISCVFLVISIRIIITGKEILSWL